MGVGREIPFSLGVWFLKERVGHRFHAMAGSRTDTSSGVGAHAYWWTTELCASLTTSALCNIPAHPPSVILALQQAHGYKLNDAVSRAWDNGGWRGFYAGYLVRTIAIAGTMTVVPLILSRGKDLGLA